MRASLASTSVRRCAAALCLSPLLAAAPAMAQSSVSLYGLVDVSAGRFQSLGGTAVKGVESGKMSTSYFGLRGAEDLGGGTSAVFAIESFMRNDTAQSGRFDADTFWARNAYVGLAHSKAGTVTLGRNTTSLFVSVLVFNPFGDSFGFSPSIRHYFTTLAGVSATTGDTGWSDSVKYTSPNFGGLSFTAHGALGEGNGGKNAGLSATYFGGPLGATFAWQKAHKGAAVADTTTWNLGASYDFGAAKLFGQYGQVDNTTTGRDYKLTGLGASVGLGGGKLLAQWGRLAPSVGNSTTTITVGYDYFLSKRTDAYLMAMQDKRSGLSSGKSIAVGVRHRF